MAPSPRPRSKYDSPELRRTIWRILLGVGVFLLADSAIMTWLFAMRHAFLIAALGGGIGILGGLGMISWSLLGLARVRAILARRAAEAQAEGAPVETIKT